MSPDPTGPDVAALRETIACGCRILSTNGHDDYIWGHVSGRDPDGRGAWLKASGQAFEEVVADSVQLVSFEGEVLDGEGSRHSEWPIHTEILAARPDVAAVVHSHPPHAIALAAAQLPLLPVSHAGTLFVPPEVPRFDLTSNLITDRELGQALAACLGRENAAFMVNHGIVTCGANLQEAVVRAVLLEKACYHQILTLRAGGEMVWTGPEEALEKRSKAWPPAHLLQLWDYLERKDERQAGRRA